MAVACDIIPRLKNPTQPVITQQEAKDLLNHLSKKYGIQGVMTDLGIDGPYGVYQSASIGIEINSWTDLDEAGQMDLSVRLDRDIRGTNNYSRRTIFHEYLHPFVQVLRDSNEELYNQIVEAARTIDADINFTNNVLEQYSEDKRDEELVVRYLEHFSDDDTGADPPGLLKKFMEWLSSLFFEKRTDKKLTKDDLVQLSPDTTIDELYEVFTKYGYLRDDARRVGRKNALQRELESVEDFIEAATRTIEESTEGEQKLTEALQMLEEARTEANRLKEKLASYSKRPANTESELFPQIQQVTQNREQAKNVYSQVFDQDFLAWYGNWPEGVDNVGNATGEPMLLSTKAKTITELLIPSVGNKPYGKGTYFTTPKSGARQHGFIKVSNPLISDEVAASTLKTGLRKVFQTEVPPDLAEKLERAASSDNLKTTTRLVEDVVREMEYISAKVVWSHMEDVKNVWELFGYDGIVDGDTYVLFNQYDYWMALEEPSDLPAAPEESQTPPETPDKSKRILDMLARKFGATVEYTKDLPAHTIARVSRQGDRPIIQVHPDRIQQDTLFHEYAHIMIDGIGGLSNPMVARGVELLRGTTLWEEVAGRYPDLSEQGLAKEVLAEAIGREASQLAITTPTLLKQVKDWLNLMYNKLRQVFGLSTGDVRSLARQLLSEQLDPNYSIKNLPSEYQEKRQQAQGNQRVLDRKNKLYEKTLSQMDYRIQELRQRNDKAGVKALQRTRHELRKDLKNTLNYSGMIYYLNQAYKDLDDLYTELYNAVGEGTLTSQQLMQIYTSAQAYNTLPDVEYFVTNNPEASKELGPEYVQNLDFLRNTLEKINRIFQEESLELAVDFLKPSAQRKRKEIENRYKAEWREKHPKSQYAGREDRYNIDMNAYAERRIQAEHTAIEEEIENDLRMQLQEAHQDVGSVEMWMTAMKNVDDEILQLVAETVDRAELKVIRNSIELKKQIENVLEDLRAHKGNPANPEKLFEDVLETDSEGNLTCNIIAPYHSLYQELEKAFLESTSEIRKNDQNLWRLRRDEFYDEHGKRNPEHIQWNKDREAAKKELSDEDYQEWLVENRPPQEYIPADKYKNKAFNKFDPEHKDYLGDEHPVVRFYNFYVSQQGKYDDMLPFESKRLGYRLPSIRKTSVERIVAGQPQQMIENLRDQFRWTVDDIEEGEILTEENEQGEKVLVRRDARGNRLQYIPIHYRSSVPAKDQSFDLGTLLLLNAHMSMNYKEKNQIMADLQIVEEQIRTRRVGQHKGVKEMFLKDNPTRRHTIPGELSRSYQLMESFMDFRIYGRHTTEKDPLYDHSKKIGALMSYTGMLLLGGNVLAGVANVAFGETMFFSEAAAGQYINLSNWNKANKFYGRNIANTSIIGDLGRGKYTSVVNLLMDHYDTLNSYNPITHKFADKNAFFRLAKQSTIYGINNVGEHRMHNVTLLATLDRLKAVNDKGEWLDKDGKVVTERKKAASMLDLQQAEDGELKSPKWFNRVEWDGKFYQTGEDLDFRITQRVRQLNEYMHGAYSDQNSNYLQRYSLGRMAIMMRKWIEPGVRRRFAGITRVHKGKRDMRWDHQLNDFHEGTVTTAYRFLRNAWTEGENWKFALAANWQKMTDIERANMYRAFTEAAMMAIMFTLAKISYSIAQGMDDDEEANKYWWMGYQANRLFSELMFYYPPVNIQEAYRVLKSPAATIAIWERTGRLLLQFADPADRYETGFRKDRLKIGKYAQDMVPFLNPIERMDNMAELVSIVYNPN